MPLPVLLVFTMAVSVDIVSTEEGNCGWSCHVHSYCGQVLDVGSVVRVKLEKNFFKGSTKPTLACYWVHDGCAQCKVGFLPHHLVAHAANYDGSLLQITEVLSEDDDTNMWKAEKVKNNQGYCFAKVIGTASEMMEFKSQARHFVHPATNLAAGMKRKNKEEEAEGRV